MNQEKRILFQVNLAIVQNALTFDTYLLLAKAFCQIFVSG